MTYLPLGETRTSKHCLGLESKADWREEGLQPSGLTAGIEYFLKEIAVFGFINKPFVWALNGSPISGLLMDVYAHTCLCTHTKQHKYLCSTPLWSTPGWYSLTSLVSYFAVHPGKYRVAGAPGIVELCAWGQKSSGHSSPLSDTAPADTHQGLLFSPPKEGCHLTPAPSNNAKRSLEVVRSMGFPLLGQFLTSHPRSCSRGLESSSRQAAVESALWTSDLLCGQHRR